MVLGTVPAVPSGEIGPDWFYSQMSQERGCSQLLQSRSQNTPWEGGSTAPAPCTSNGSTPHFPNKQQLHIHPRAAFLPGQQDPHSEVRVPRLELHQVPTIQPQLSDFASPDHDGLISKWGEHSTCLITLPEDLMR